MATEELEVFMSNDVDLVDRLKPLLLHSSPNHGLWKHFMEKEYVPEELCEVSSRETIVGSVTFSHMVASALCVHWYNHNWQ